MRDTSCFPCFVLLLSGLLFVQNGFAQRGPRANPPGMQEALIDTLISTLELTDELVPAVRAILETRANSLMALRPDPGGGRGQFQAMRAKRQAIDQETETALAALLTREQMTLYRKFIDNQSRERRQQMRRRNQEDRP